MKRARRLGLWTAAVVVIASAIFVTSSLCTHSLAHACGSETYSARGVVKSFGPSQSFVNIAHEEIAGYMAAMTMSFEPRTADQLAGLNSGDKVSFSFTATDDGRRLLNSVKKKE